MKVSIKNKGIKNNVFNEFSSDFWKIHHVFFLSRLTAKQQRFCCQPQLEPLVCLYWGLSGCRELICSVSEGYSETSPSPPPLGSRTTLIKIQQTAGFSICSLELVSQQTSLTCLWLLGNEDTLEEGGEAGCHLPVGTAGSLLGVGRK